LGKIEHSGRFRYRNQVRMISFRPLYNGLFVKYWRNWLGMKCINNMNESLPGVIRKEKKTAKKKNKIKVSRCKGFKMYLSSRNEFEDKLDVLMGHIFCDVRKCKRRQYIGNIFMYHKCPNYHKIRDSCIKIISVFDNNRNLTKNYMRNYLLYDHKLVEKDFLYEKRKFELNVLGIYEGKPRKNKFYAGETKDIIWNYYATDQY